MSAKRTRMHWGVGLLVVFGVFVGAILTMVVISLSREVDLVTDGYYEKELRYQERIHALQRAQDPQNAITLTETRTEVVVQFPTHRPPGSYTGTIVLYRPASLHDDVTIPVATDATCRQVIHTARLARGLWRLQLEWRADGETCFVEKLVTLQ